MLIRCLISCCLIASAFTALDLAPAHDHRPPRTVLKSGPAVQKGLLNSYCWSRADPPGFIGECADGLLKAWHGGYDAVFRLPNREGHYYLGMSGRWLEEEGAIGDQDASWGFHLKLVR